MQKTILKQIVLVAVLIITIVLCLGFLGPQLISAASWGLVLLGIAVTVIGAAAVCYLLWWTIALVVRFVTPPEEER